MNYMVGTCEHCALFAVANTVCIQMHNLEYVLNLLLDIFTTKL